MAQATWRTIWQLLIKLNIHVPYDSAITFLGTQQEMFKHMLTKGLVKQYHKILTQNSQKLEKHTCQLTKKVDKQMIIYSQSRIFPKKKT